MNMIEIAGLLSASLYKEFGIVIGPKGVSIALTYIFFGAIPAIILMALLTRPLGYGCIQ